jgi:hypothetical protein
MKVSKFMLKLSDDFEAKVASSTADLYLRNLYTLNGDKPFNNLAFLKNKDAILEIIQTYAPNTRKSMFITIMGTIKHSSAVNKKKTYIAVRDWAEDQIKDINKSAPGEGVKSQKQIDNWVDWSEVIQKREELKELVDSFGRRVTQSQYNKVLQYLTLSLYTMIPPRRALDYQSMYIVKQWGEDMSDKKNYLSLKDNKLVFNVYKTAKTYGRQSFLFGDDLREVIEKYLSYYPTGWTKKSDNEPLLVDYSGERMCSNNVITRLLNKVFAPKKVSVNLLRHIFLSDKYGSELEEMKDDANAMGHSLGMQRAYVKDD